MPNFRRFSALLAGMAVVSAILIPAAPASALSTIEGSLAAPTVTTSVAAGNVITLGFTRADGDVTTPGVTLTYRWYRGTAAIYAANKASYTLTAADRGQQIGIRITVAKSGYSSAQLVSALTDYTLPSVGPATITGNPKTGEYLEAHRPQYSVVAPDTESWQWYRDGVAIAGATTDEYRVLYSDFGKKISVRAVGSKAGYLPLLSNSTALKIVQEGTFSCCLQGIVEWHGLVLKAFDQGLDPAPRYTWQWYRNGVAVKGATKQTYTLTSADYRKDITVRIGATLPHMTPIDGRSSVLTNPLSYTLDTAGLPVIIGPTPNADGDIAVGRVLSVKQPAYTNTGYPEPPTSFAYQWYRNGAAIAHATNPTYTAVTADKGTAISVRVIARAVLEDGKELLPAIRTSAPTPKLGTNAFVGDLMLPAVTFDSTARTLTQNGPGISSELPTGTTVTYQWYRNGVAISGATKPVYKLVSADTGKNINLRFAIIKSTYTTLFRFTPQTIYPAP